MNGRYASCFQLSDQGKEQLIASVREGIKSSVWNGITTMFTTSSPQYALLVGVTKGATTSLYTFFEDQKLEDNVPAIMKLQPFHWVEKFTRFIADP